MPDFKGKERMLERRRSRNRKLRQGAGARGGNWVRELSKGKAGELFDKEGCRHVGCTREVAKEDLIHGYCESCWGSRIRVLAGASGTVVPTTVSTSSTPAKQPSE